MRVFFNAETGAVKRPKSGPKIYFANSFHFEEDWNSLLPSLCALPRNDFDLRTSHVCSHLPGALSSVSSGFV